MKSKILKIMVLTASIVFLNSCKFSEVVNTVFHSGNYKKISQEETKENLVYYQQLVDSFVTKYETDYIITRDFEFSKTFKILIENDDFYEVTIANYSDEEEAMVSRFSLIKDEEDFGKIDIAIYTELCATFGVKRFSNKQITKLTKKVRPDAKEDGGYYYRVENFSSFSDFLLTYQVYYESTIDSYVEEYRATGPSLLGLI